MPLRRGSAPSPEERFASEIISLVHEILGLKAKQLDDFALLIDHPGSPPVTMNLQNVYLEAQQLRGQARTERLRRAVLAILPQPHPASWHDAAPLLMPAVRTPSWANATASMTLARPPARVPFGKPLAPFVKLLCAIDFEHSMSFATSADLSTWGVTDDEALRTASANLTREPCQVSRHGPTAQVTGPDGYASSWLAVPAALATIAADISGTVVAVAVARDQLMLIDAEHPEVSTRMLELALEQYQTSARQLSPVPYLISDAGIEPWTPPTSHPASPIVDKAAHYLAAVEYDHQQAMLDELFVKTGEDVYVATLTMMRRQDGSLWSWTTWVKQVTNGLLPRADVLMLTDNNNPDTHIAIRWDDAVRIAGHSLQEEAGYDPPRWRHRGWPDDDTMASLRTQAIPALSHL